ncbi:MAG: DUF1566 domain-containing protein [Methylococcaceae bacterium]|nr:DUF1566 domain-containing protein [Methylococcaceae bacterium]
MFHIKSQSVNHLASSLVLALSLGFSGASEAQLKNMGNGLINDTDLNVTWLRDANSFFTLSGKGKDPAKAQKLIDDIIAVVPSLADAIEVHDIVREDFNTRNGKMSWWGAKAWVDYLNSINYKGFNDWRLPLVNPVNGVELNCTTTYDGSTDDGYNTTAVNPTAHELPHVFYQELHNLSQVKLNGLLRSKGYGLKKKGPFAHLKKSLYWTGTPNPLYAAGGDMFHFDTKNGGMGHDQKVFPLNAYAWIVRTGLAPKQVSRAGASNSTTPIPTGGRFE